MDLGLMSRKLRAAQYTSKQSFEADLNLIWSNCLLYNSDPVSIYRMHAMKMKEKADELMRKVPNISIRTRAELQADGYESDHVTYGELSTVVQNSEVSPTVPAAGTGASTLEDLENLQMSPPEDGMPLLQKMAELVMYKRDLSPTLDDMSRKNESLTPSTVSSLFESPKNAFMLFPSVELEYAAVSVGGDKLRDEFLKITIDARMDLLWNRMVQSELQFGQRQALERLPSDMGSFYDRRNSSLPELYNSTSTLPDLHAPAFKPPSIHSLTDYRTCLLSEQAYGPYQQSVQTLRECKRYERKILEFTQPSLITEKVAETDDEPDAEIKLRIPNIMSGQDIIEDRVDIGEEAARDLLTRSLSLVLLQTGFDSEFTYNFFRLFLRRNTELYASAHRCMRPVHIQPRARLQIIHRTHT